MRFTLVLGTLLGSIGLSSAQILDLSTLDRLDKKARESTSVNLDADKLLFASKFLSSEDGDQVKAKRLIANLRGVFVRAFEFDKEGQYNSSDLETLRTQLRKPGWSKIVEVKSREDREATDIYVRSDAKGITGLAIIAAEPLELTVVQLVGAIDPEDLSSLSGTFGIPRIDLGPVKATPKKTPAAKDD